MDSSDDLVIHARTKREAFGRLYDLYYPRVFRYCLRRLFARAVAEDVTSEVFLRVAAHIHDFPGTTEEDFRRWLYRVATNDVNAFLRRSRRHCELRESAVRTHAIRVLDTEDHPRGKDVDDPDWAEVYQAILTLKPREQTVNTLRFSEQMSHDQIAGVLNLQPATVRVVLSRALEKLRLRLGVRSERTTTKSKD
jgi:RNA polymerase sigma-70 factor (ECF subfamily)